MDIIQQIKDVALRKDGKVNSAVIRRDWFLESDLWAAILKQTDFLPEGVRPTQRIYVALNGIKEVPLCMCGSERVFLPRGEYSDTCGQPSCRTVASINTRKDTMMERYGALVSPKTRQKASERAHELFVKGRKTLMERYGVEAPSHVEGSQEKRIATLQERYGVDDVSKIPSVVERIKERQLDRYTEMGRKWVDVLGVDKRVDDDRQLFNIDYKCKECGYLDVMKGETFKWRCDNDITPCKSCSGQKGGSAGENELYEYVASILPDQHISRNDRHLLGPLELDIVIDELDVAFEYDGMFWHSYDSHETTEERRSHLNKTEQCEEIGLRLIHVFESEWMTKQEIVKSRIASAVGRSYHSYYGRECEIVELTNQEAREFLERTHIQGSPATGARVAYGLRLQKTGELVAVMTFGKPRYSKHQWELLRYSGELYTNVVGGASKLFKHFVREQNPDSVVSYADRRWASLTPMYGQLGFEFQNFSQPNYFYLHHDEGLMVTHSRVTFQKHKLPELLEDFDDTLTEADNMFKNGYRRIWDCGTSVWVWESEDE